MANALKKVRFFLKWNLIFSFCLAACSEHANKNEAVVILWSGGKAEGSFCSPQIPLNNFPGFGRITPARSFSEQQNSHVGGA